MLKQIPLLRNKKLRHVTKLLDINTDVPQKQAVICTNETQVRQLRKYSDKVRRK